MKFKFFGKRLKHRVLCALLPAFALNGNPAFANPQGGVVVHGAADIARISANQLRIHQQSNAVVINWQDFSIGRGQMTRFVQPNNGTALNRVVSGNISQIHGQLKANANVYVVNPNGIVIGANGVIDVGGNAVLSTLDIDDDDFLNGGANRFYGDSNTGVTNFGTISSASGDVVLMGGFVDNQGQIGALNGTVAIGSGGDILLQEGAAGSKISVRGSSEYQGTGINNEGTIRGAAAELKAHGNVYALAINNGGAIRATGADRSSGRVLLRASGGSSNINLGQRSTIVAKAGSDGGSVAVDAGNGQALVEGNIDASGTRNGGAVSVIGNQVAQAPGSVIDATGGAVGGTVAVDAVGSVSVAGTVKAESTSGIGGKVDITGQTVLINDSANISANGHSAGGQIRVGGDFQGRDTGLREADSTRVDDGARLSADSFLGYAGTVIVWANHDTLFLGDVSASALGNEGDGGLVEVSGKETLYFDGVARVSTIGGKAGTVLFDPGNVVIGAAGSTTAPLPRPTTDSLITIASVNDTLQSGAHVLVVTESGNIVFESQGGGGDDLGGAQANNRNSAVQWTNSQSSFGAFASGSIIVNNHIRTSGAGSINLLAGWGGGELDPQIDPGQLNFDPQTAWDFYVGNGSFGEGGGSILIGSNSQTRHIEVGSRYGDTNVAGFEVRVVGSDTVANIRYSMIGFHDGGQVFAPRLDRGTDGGSVAIRLDMKVGDPTGNGAWLLSDGRNNNTLANNQAAAGVGDPIVGIVGQNEVDLNGDGIVDGVRGINSTGVVADTFIPYASHFNSATSGNWWWQQIEDAGSAETKDPLGLGGIRPENGAGVGSLSSKALAMAAPINGADINVIARGSVLLQTGNGNEAASAFIGHGGPNRTTTGAGGSIRAIGTETVGDVNFSTNPGIEGTQLERRWTINGSDNDRVATSIARLAPVYGNINVYAGVNTAAPISVNHTTGRATATVTNGGTVTLRAAQTFDTGGPTSNSSAQIGHGGIGQFGEFYGNIHVEAGGSITLLAGEGTRATASIGHTITGHAYWNPTSVEDQQIRFFATAGDFDNPNLRRGELFSGNVTTGFDPALDPEAARRYNLANFPDNGFDANGFPINTTLGYSVNQYTRGTSGPGTSTQGRNALAPLDLAPNGPITVAALDGSAVTGFHGDITAIARNGDITLRGYSTEGVTVIAARDTRFASIGHGGRSFGYATLGSGYQNILTTPTVPVDSNGNPDGREIITYHMPSGTGANTGSRSDQGTAGTSVNRSPVFMSISGDIDVFAGNEISMIAGNDIYDYTQIGHGGPELADYETSSFLFGDIRVRAGGDITVIGGGTIQPINRGTANDPGNGSFNYDLRAWSQIGHGGYRSGFYGFIGDIDVDAGGSILIRGGAFALSPAKIGHQTVDDRGQSGGSFVRSESFRADGIVSDIQTNLDAASATVVYTSASSRGVVGSRDIGALGAGDLVESTFNTANIQVVAGGGVTLDHLQMGQRQPAERLALAGADLTHPNFNVNNQNLGIRTRNSYSQIGHGGNATNAFVVTNTATNYDDKIGDITVIANGGDIELLNGEGEHRWTRIGHGVGRGDRANDPDNTAGYSRSIDLAGNITIASSGSVSINADAADENERTENFDTPFGSAAPSRFNPVAIGHGGVDNNLDLVVLGQGEMVNGIAASSDISLVADGSLAILGGKGVDASFAQLGHGFASDLGNDAARRFGVPVGFAGDITVAVSGSIYLEAGANAWSELPSATSNNEGQSVHGAFAAIGHGGYQLDAPSFGDVTVYAGQDVSVIAQRRTDPFTDTIGQSPYSITNPTPGLDSVSSAFNFAKIGHFAVENGNRAADGSDLVQSATQTGDITVVVGRDLTVQGGTTPDIDTQTIFGAFAQIGHGGPAASGDLTGDITVLVKRNLSVVRGTDVEAGDQTLVQVNNYAMIGNGDYLRGTNASPSSIFRREGQGFRVGDIVIATGNNATFNDALVGHADPFLSSQTTLGNTQVAVSRLNPFFGGTGTLTATDTTVFSSGGFGVQSRVEFYMPARSNNLMDPTTRINEKTATFVAAPANFAAPFNAANGILAGRNDEVYLTPDLWWDQTGRAAGANIPGAGVFPTDAVSGQGGAIAIVSDPGGIANLESLSSGLLGSSAPVYRDQNGVSGAGLYTIYYDATEFVVNEFPTQPTAPGIPIPDAIFDFRGLVFSETYDSFFRDDLYNGLGGEGEGLFPLLGLFEREGEFGDEANFENRLDRLFGDTSEDDEEEEEERRRRARANAAGAVGSTFYVYEPGTNRYSSYRVFGNQLTSLPLPPEN